MKKMFLLFAMTLIIANNLSAEEFVVEGVRYSITSSSDEQRTVKVMGCTNIPADSSVVIPASVEYNDNEFAVTSIGTDAFYCIWLKNITLPEGLLEIEDYAFRCSNLEKLVIPNSVINVGGAICADCQKLTEVIIGDNVKEIKSGAFENCISLSNIVLGKSITSIGYRAFRNARKITSVMIPDAVEYIGEHAFACPELSEVTFGLGLKEIGTGTFAATKLTSVVLPEGLEIIGPSAFYNSKNLQRVDVGGNVKTIGDGAFMCCNLQKFKMPDTVTELGENAFYGNGQMSEIHISNQVKELKKYAFFGCHSLTSVNIPQSVRRIDWAFESCSNLSSITLPDTLEFLGESSFSGCANMKTFVIGEHTDTIASSVFYGCDKFTVCKVMAETPPAIAEKTFINGEPYIVSVPKGSLNLYLAHNYWNKLNIVEDLGDVEVTVDIPGTLDECLKATLIDYANVLRLKINGNVNEEDFALIRDNLPNVYALDMEDCACQVIPAEAFYNKFPLIEYVFPNNTKEIGNRAFYGCNRIEQIDMPTTVNKIEEYAFSQMSGLKKLVIKDLASWCSIEFGNEFANPIMYSKSFYQNDEPATNVCIPEGVERIANYAFLQCESMETLVTPSTMLAIGDYAFQKCKNLKSATLSNSITSIGNRAFYECKNMQIDLPANLETIGDYSFRNCYGIRHLNIPVSLKKVGNGAFAQCDSLKTVNTTDLQHWCNIAFSSNTSNPIHITKSLSLNGEIITDLVIPDEVSTVNNYSFYGCEALKSITFNTNATSIGNYSFNKCTNVKAIDFPETLASIGTYAFAEIDSLKYVVFNSTVTISNYAFTDCPNISSITSFAENPKSFKNNTFELDVYDNATLLIPFGTSTVYANTTGWKNFKVVQEMEETGITDVHTSENGFVICDNHLQLNNYREDEPISVFDLSGKTIYNGYGQTVHIESKGVYMIRIGDTVRKFIIR